MESYALLVGTLNAGTCWPLRRWACSSTKRPASSTWGAEGMMLCAAIAGFATVVHTGSDLAGFSCGHGRAPCWLRCLGWLVIWLNTNQYATGLALSLFGGGFRRLGIGYVQETARAHPLCHSRGLADVPCWGRRCSASIPGLYHDGLDGGAGVVLLPLASGWFALGGRVALNRPMRWVTPCGASAWLAWWRGRAVVRLAGAYISVVYTPLWVEGMVAGKGWIALALTTLPPGGPLRVLLGAYLFGGVTMLQFHLQGHGVDIPSQLLSMLPMWPPSWCWR